MGKQRTRERLERQRVPEDEGQQRTLPESVHEVLASSGQALDTETRALMEPRFAYDFSRVRIHTDDRAAQSAREVDALAYTQGSDIVFAQGQYTPETQEGKGLLAHELTHVVQQRDVNTQSLPTPGPENDSYEQQAERMSAAAMMNASPTMVENFSSPGPGSVIQRKRPTMEQRLEALEKREQADEDKIADLENHQQAQNAHLKAVDIDLAWQAKFAKRFSSYKEAIDRISGGLQASTKGFQEAQEKQKEFEAAVMSAVGAVLTLAGGFEWAFVPGLGKLGIESEKTAEHILSVSHAAADVTVDVAKEAMAHKTETPAPASIPGAQTPAGLAGGDPLAFLTSNTAALESHQRNIFNAFAQRSLLTQGFSDEDWLKFDLNAQDQLYQQLFDHLQTVASGAEQLEQDNIIALVLERHLWASWIGEQAEGIDKEMQEEQKYFEMSNPLMSMAVKGAEKVDEKWQEEMYGHEMAKPESKPASEEMFTPGAEIEKRLIEINVDILAGVELTGHWYSSNSPDNWRELLIKWAHEYKGSISK